MSQRLVQEREVLHEVKTNGADQVQKIVALFKHHVTECQRSQTVGKLLVEVEFIRGGKDGSRLKSPKIKYNGTWEFIDKVDGLG